MNAFIALSRAGLIGLALVTACSGGDDGTTPPPPPPPPGVTVVRFEPTGDGQRAPISTALTLPIRMRALRAGQPAANELVSWTVTAGNGTVTPAQATTGADGTATTLWSLGTLVGAQSIRASLANGAAVSFAATAAPGGAPEGVVELFSSPTPRFSPALLTVSVGTTVAFKFRDGFHDIHAIDAPALPSSGPPREGGPDHRYNFPSPGFYNYYCAIHGTPTSGMRGTVKVE